MSTSTTLAAYGAALALVLGAAFGVGNAVGPVGPTAGPDHSTEAPHGTDSDMDMDMDDTGPGHDTDTGHDGR